MSQNKTKLLLITSIASINVPVKHENIVTNRTTILTA